jgi:hypothetical protein
MPVSKALLDTLEINRRAVVMTESEFRRTLQDMLVSGIRSCEGRLCIVRPESSGGRASAYSLRGQQNIARDRRIVIVRTASRFTGRSFVESTAKALGLRFARSTQIAELLETIAVALARQDTRMLIFENMPPDFGGRFVGEVLEELLRRGLQIACLFTSAEPARDIG